jgi:hypothetical protein
MTELQQLVAQLDQDYLTQEQVISIMERIEALGGVTAVSTLCFTRGLCAKCEIQAECQGKVRAGASLILSMGE